MLEPVIRKVDAAGGSTVGGAPAGRLLGFVRDLTNYVVARDDAQARRALCSPYVGLENADARALCTVAGERRTLIDTIERGAVPLPHDRLLAARRFARALSELAEAYRAQGATAAEHVATIRLSLALDEGLDARERATFARVESLAANLDAGRTPGIAWDAKVLVRTLEREARNAAVVEPAPIERHPLPPRERETPRVVRRRKAHFSASSLGAFAECERRWYYRYVCAAVEDTGSSASTYGSAFHWGLERFHEEFPRADAAPPEMLARKLEGALNTAFEHFRSGFETSVEFELQRRRAQRTGRRYLRWLLERGRRHPFSVIATEATAELVLDGYNFIGYIDRLDRDDATGAVTVVDYKTGNIAQSAEEYRAKVARFVEFQLPFYYFARTAAGDRVSRIALVPLKDASREVEPIELEVVPVSVPRSYADAPTGTIGIDELERARVRMVELAAMLADGPLESFAVTDDPSACAYCAYVNACRDRPLPNEDRFGR